MPQIPLDEIDDSLVGITVSVMNETGYETAASKVTNVYPGDKEGHFELYCLYKHLSEDRHHLYTFFYTFFEGEVWTVHVTEDEYLKWLCNRAEKGGHNG